MSRTDRRTRRARAAHRDDDLLTSATVLLTALEQAAPGRVAARAFDRLGMAHDASHYLLVRQAVVTSRGAAEGAGLLRVAGAGGLLHPELTASATAPETSAVARRPGAAYASVNRAGELGMTRATGQPYRHVLEVLEDVTRPTTTGDA